MDSTYSQFAHRLSSSIRADDRYKNARTNNTEQTCDFFILQLYIFVQLYKNLYLPRESLNFFSFSNACSMLDLKISQDVFGLVKATTRVTNRAKRTWRLVEA
jgi:hypothetical protein